MNRLNTEEANFLSKLTPMLNDTANKQTIINMVRSMVSNARNRGIQQGRSGWQVDQNWSDKELM
jgi:hypothetical protein